MKPTKKVFLALDNPDLDYCLSLAEELKSELAGVKLGLEFFTANGPDGVRKFVKSNVPVFLDLKFHDIPNTVRKAVREACKLGVDFLTIHAAGGFEMLKAANEEALLFAKENNKKKPIIFAVTILTSMAEEELRDIGVKSSLKEQILQLAKLTKSSGVDGIVCSALEVSLIKAELGNKFLTLTPGIRFAEEIDNANIQDQKRVVTPEEAINLGSDYLVMGRSLTNTPDPKSRLRQIC